MNRLKNNAQLRFAPPGHFYSPLPDIDEFPRSTSDRQCLGIDLRESEQCEMLSRFARFYTELPFSDEPSQRTRFYYRNNFFGHSDAIVLFSMMRLHCPRLVIEIGSGFSSAVMLDVKEMFLDGRTRLVLSTLPRSSAHPFEAFRPIRTTRVSGRGNSARPFQGTPCEGDILFIDSSHVAKYGSDVNDLFFRILPVIESWSPCSRS